MLKNQKTAKNEHFLKGVNMAIGATQGHFYTNFSSKFNPHTQLFSPLYLFSKDYGHYHYYVYCQRRCCDDKKYGI